MAKDKTLHKEYRIIQRDFDVNIKRLREIQEKGFFQYLLLNDFSHEFNERIKKANINIRPIAFLSRDQSAYMGGGGRPSNTESATMNELITKHEQALAIISSTIKKSVFRELLESSASFKFILGFSNLGILAGLASLFYAIGKDTGSNEVKILSDEVAKYKEEILRYRDSLKTERLDTLSPFEKAKAQ